MNLLTLDTGRNTGWAYGSSEKPQFHGTWECGPGLTGGYGALYQHLNRFKCIHQNDLDSILVEKPFCRGKYTEEGWGWLAIVKLVFPGSVLVVPPAKNKLFFTGKGNATKLEVEMECCERGLFPVSDHEADAIALYYYGHGKIEVG